MAVGSNVILLEEHLASSHYNTHVLLEYGVGLRADRVGKFPAVYLVAAASTVGHSVDGPRPGWGYYLVSGVGQLCITTGFY